MNINYNRLDFMGPKIYATNVTPPTRPAHHPKASMVTATPMFNDDAIPNIGSE